MTEASFVRQRFLTVDGRRVRYLRAGSGSPVLLIYANSGTLTSYIERLSPTYTVFAFDNPGYCGSDPLQRDRISVADLADALAAALRAMNFPSVPVFGTHTGAAIGIELALRHPHFVSGLILDGVPIFTKDEFEAHERDGYFFRLEAQTLGGHFTNCWTRARDWQVFEPWCSRNPENIRPSSPPSSPEKMDRGIMMYFRSARHFEKPYKAAFRFGEVASDRIAQLDLSAVFTALATDHLSTHFARFPKLKPGQELIALGANPEELFLLIEKYIEKYDRKLPVPPDLPRPDSSTGIEKDFVDIGDRQIFVRSCGSSTDPAILVLHDAPGSSLALEATIEALGANHRVYAPDLPGCAESDPFPADAPSIADYVDAVKAVCAHYALEKLVVYGIGFGASVAVALAGAMPELVIGLILRGVLLPDANERRDMQENYAPRIEIDPFGAHWYRTWLMLRDSLIYWPWYKRGASAVRGVKADFDADRLHDWTVEVMRQRNSYHHLIAAALARDTESDLKSIAVPVLVCDDPAQPFSIYGTVLKALVPGAAVFEASVPQQEAKAIQVFVRDVRRQLVEFAPAP
jgi:pimeloyl-ACP methyl ester carboxylesterase